MAARKEKDLNIHECREVLHPSPEPRPAPRWNSFKMEDVQAEVDNLLQWASALVDKTCQIKASAQSIPQKGIRFFFEMQRLQKGLSKVIERFLKRVQSHIDARGTQELGAIQVSIKDTSQVKPRWKDEALKEAERTHLLEHTLEHIQRAAGIHLGTFTRMRREAEATVTPFVSAEYVEGVTDGYRKTKQPSWKPGFLESDDNAIQTR